MNKNYDVKCKVDHGELYLSITHNGYQWESVSIKDGEREIPLIISELNKYLTRHSRGVYTSIFSSFGRAECSECGSTEVATENHCARCWAVL